MMLDETPLAEVPYLQHPRIIDRSDAVLSGKGSGAWHSDIHTQHHNASYVQTCGAYILKSIEYFA